MLPRTEATRYVTPLREGGSLPGIVEAAVSDVPDEWLTPVPEAESASEQRRWYVDHLTARLAERSAWLPGEVGA